MPSKKLSGGLTIALAILGAALLNADPPAEAQREKILHSFDYNNGGYVFTGLALDALGNLYGTTNAGGQYRDQFSGGTAYELVPGANGQWTEKMLHSFGNNIIGSSYPEGIYPIGLIFDSAGNLYGVTQEGGIYSRYGDGLVFELTPDGVGGWTEKVLHQFGADHADGVLPHAGLVIDAAGNLFGTTSAGGSYGYGTVFELMPSGGALWTEKILHNFNSNGEDGYEPDAALIVDASGSLYGTCRWGGHYGFGTAFELTPQQGGTWTEKILHHFGNGPRDGALPVTSLIFDAAGNLYGTTSLGGVHGYGTAFELTTAAGGVWHEKILHSFGEGTFHVDGAGPSALIFDARGNLYGTAASGSRWNTGTVFELTPQPDGSWAEKTLHTFGGPGRDGITPSSGVILDSSGNLYGTTAYGGLYSVGAVFEITP